MKMFLTIIIIILIAIIWGVSAYSFVETINKKSSQEPKSLGVNLWNKAGHQDQQDQQDQQDHSGSKYWSKFETNPKFKNLLGFPLEVSDSISTKGRNGTIRSYYNHYKTTP